MKKINLIIVAIFLFINSIFGQSPNRYSDPNYMWNAFFEDFNSAVNRNIWNVQSHYKRDLGFLIDSPLSINVQNSNLELKMRYTPNYLDSIWKTSGWEHVYSNYTGAEISTKQLFHYGVFECRAKFAKRPGSWPAFWIIGGDGTPCPPGGYGNEIDIAELFSHEPYPILAHVIHRYYPPVDCDTSNPDEKDKKSYLVSGTEQYQIYKCIWSPIKIEYYVDNVLQHTVYNTGQEWYPSSNLSVVLSQQVCTPYNQLGQQIGVIAPQTSYFDYVQIKQFFLAPEITLSSTLICSSGTASLDVDSKATEITWQLTPASLFTTSNGSDKIANISIASGAYGEGKITYSFKMPSGESYTAEKSFAVGAPVISGISGPTSTPNNQWATYTAQLQSTLSAPSAYNWILNPLNGNSVYNYGSTCDIAFYNSGSYQLIVQAKNTCTGSGYGPYYVTGIYVYDSYRLSVSPNPTTTEATIELVSSSTEKAMKETEWDLEVYDAMQSMKAKVEKIKNNKETLNTQGWKEGVYIVRAIVGKDIVTGKLVVKP